MQRCKEILLPALALFVICAAVAGALAGVNRITSAPIARNASAEAEAARRALFPGAQAFLPAGTGVDAAIPAGDAAAPLGYVVASEAQGYGGPIKIMVGITPEGTVQQVAVLDASGETPGLGQKVKDEGFLAQFAHAALFELGGDSQTSEKKSIDGIASATYSSRGMVEAVNKAMALYRQEVTQ
jgi:electron transport complex protein RnfG